MAASFGAKVVLIDRYGELGGAGANTGTVPSKTLRETLALSGVRSRDLYGVDLSLRREATIADLMRRKERREGCSASYRKPSHLEDFLRRGAWGGQRDAAHLTLVATFPVRLSEEIKGCFKTNRCWRSTIRVAKGKREVYGKSVQELMLLEVTAGCDIVI